MLFHGGSGIGGVVMEVGMMLCINVDGKKRCVDGCCKGGSYC